MKVGEYMKSRAMTADAFAAALSAAGVSNQSLHPNATLADATIEALEAAADAPALKPQPEDTSMPEWRVELIGPPREGPLTVQVRALDETAAIALAFRRCGLLGREIAYGRRVTRVTA